MAGTKPAPVQDDGKESSRQNLAAWLYGVDDLRILPYPLPSQLGPHDVRVQMKAVGICGSDVHYLKKMECSIFKVEKPMVIGHESAGVVLKVGDEVKSCKPGDAVALEPGVSCGRCRQCATGHYNLCPDMAYFATPPYHGSLAQQIVHPDHLCFVLPDGVSLEEGAMCEPLSVCIHACRRAGSLVGCSVAVLGGGPIGLITMLVARVFGATRVAILDVNPDRLAFAKDLDADATVLGSSNPADEQKTVDALNEALRGRIDVSFDCAGVESTMRVALRATAAGGKVVLIGAGATEMRVPLTEAAAREIDVVGVLRYLNTYPLCLELMASGRVDVKPLITHRFGLSQGDVALAFETSARGGGAIKVMFNL